jgi:hypothetical protein
MIWQFESDNFIYMVIFPDYLIPKVISDYLSIAFREKLKITVAKHVIILVAKLKSR